MDGKSKARRKAIDNAKLGLFVLAGLLFMIFSLYMIGRNRNLFGATFTISAIFYNVNGLTPGNNVRFSGIDVGTVNSIDIESDSTIPVSMILDKKMKRFLKQNAVATIGTDGLMGNKLININTQPGPSAPLQTGDRIQSLKPIETDEMLRTLNTTNDNIEIITANLKSITQKLNNSNSLWNLLADTVIATDLKKSVMDIRTASDHALHITNDIRLLMQKVKKGEGMAGAVLNDTAVFYQLRQSANEIQEASKRARLFTDDLNHVMQQVKKGEGTAGELLYDTAMSNKVHRSMAQLEQGITRFNKNMEAMKHNFLFRSYFKKQEKEAGKKK
jgi:phospholipid/cholesterol/gamma-HCH transport system substrate-binding protein